MATFLVRVELHGKTYSHQSYTDLHTAMEKAGFARKIYGSDGKWYHLPSAEYQCTANLTAEQVREAVKAIVRLIDTSYSVLVVEWTSASWFGLTSL